MIWEQETASTLNMGLHIDLRILDDLLTNPRCNLEKTSMITCVLSMIPTPRRWWHSWKTHSRKMTEATLVLHSVFQPSNHKVTSALVMPVSQDLSLIKVSARPNMVEHRVMPAAEQERTSLHPPQRIGTSSSLLEAMIWSMRAPASSFSTWVTASEKFSQASQPIVRWSSQSLVMVAIGAVIAPRTSLASHSVRPLFSQRNYRERCAFPALMRRTEREKWANHTKTTKMKQMDES